MQAAPLTQHGTPGVIRVTEFPRPAPAPGEVLVEVKACGLNHLDLWAEEGALPVPVQLPRILGGEIAGVVRELGAEVEGWQPGARVAIQSNLFCGNCEFCRRGEESICLHGKLLGVDRDGGFAEFVTVPARSLVSIPDKVDFAASAAMTLAGSTAMHMLTHRTQVKAGDWVLVMAGASGVGSYAIQIARQLGARVISTGSTETKRRFAAGLGAEYAIDLADPGWPAQVREITGKRGVDLVVEHIGGEVFEKLFQCLARGGTIVTCGATAGKDVRINLWPFFVKQQRLVGSYGRNREDLVKIMDWAAAGRVHAVIDREVSLEQIGDAFAALRSRSVLGKIVVTP